MSAEDRTDALIDERELAEALRGLRPERDAFRARVERRIREGEARHDAQAPEASEARAADGTWWRRAAAWLPGEVVPGAVAGAGAKLSWKALPGLIALPALAFAMMVMPVYLALLTVGQQSGSQAEARLAAVRGWWREHRRAGLAVLALIGIVFLVEPASAGVALLLVSTGVLALLLARLRAAGFGRRADVARHCAHLLVALALWMAMFGGPWHSLLPSDRSSKLGFCVLALSAVVCALVALREDYSTPWRMLTRSNGGDAALLFLAVLLPVVSIGQLWSSFVDAPEPEDRARHLDRLLQPNDFESWDFARKSAAYLRSQGVEPDLAWLRAHWHERRSRDEQKAGFLAAGIDLGFVEQAELDALATDARALLQEQGPIRSASLRERADLLALVRAESLTEQERDELAERLLASRDAGEQPWTLQRMATVGTLLDELGRAGLADGLREDAHALLRKCWVPPGRFSDEAGFIAFLSPSDRQPFVPHTHDAIDLMLRFGAPEEIDLRAMARRLERERRRWPGYDRADLEWEADLAFAKLERGLLPEMGPLGLLSANRVLLALVALAAFCVAATLRAPRAPRT